MHFVWHKDTNEFLGINTFGIRLRHACFDAWLRSKKDIQFVMSNLREANFDPEFFQHHEDEISAAFNKRYPSIKAA